MRDNCPHYTFSFISFVYSHILHFPFVIKAINQISFSKIIQKFFDGKLNSCWNHFEFRQPDKSNIKSIYQSLTNIKLKLREVPSIINNSWVAVFLVFSNALINHMDKTFLKFSRFHRVFSFNIDFVVYFNFSNLNCFQLNFI